MDSQIKYTVKYRDDAPNIIQEIVLQIPPIVKNWTDQELTLGDVVVYGNKDNELVFCLITSIKTSVYQMGHINNEREWHRTVKFLSYRMPAGLYTFDRNKLRPDEFRRTTFEPSFYTKARKISIDNEIIPTNIQEWLRGQRDLFMSSIA